jgi:hypothetical protein
VSLVEAPLLDPCPWPKGGHASDCLRAAPDRRFIVWLKQKLQISAGIVEGAAQYQRILSKHKLIHLSFRTFGIPKVRKSTERGCGLHEISHSLEQTAGLRLAGAVVATPTGFLR